MRKWLIGVLLAWCIGAGAQTSSFTVVDGKIGNSLIKIAVPSVWNKDVLIFAHGLRDAASPLSAEFSTNDVFFKTLSGEGWLIASTSYRRNGYIINEAIDDLDALRHHIAETYGKPNRVFLEGASMGGAIVTRMAETRGGAYNGVVAIGPVLVMGRNPYDYNPKMPLLMLSNQNEFRDPPAYAAKATNAVFKPARWIVKRDGHCNTTSEEELAAFRAVVKWAEGDGVEVEKDGTTAAPVPDSVAVFADGKARAKVLHCASGRGSCDTEFTAADMVRLGIGPRSRFEVTCREKTVAVFYGKGYFDVPKGEWVAFVPAASGRLRIARNYADAVSVLGCAAGDEMSIGPVLKPEGPPK